MQKRLTLKVAGAEPRGTKAYAWTQWWSTSRSQHNGHHP